MVVAALDEQNVITVFKDLVQWIISLRGWLICLQEVFGSFITPHYEKSLRIMCFGLNMLLGVPFHISGFFKKWLCLYWWTVVADSVTHWTGGYSSVKSVTLRSIICNEILYVKNLLNAEEKMSRIVFYIPYVAAVLLLLQPALVWATEKLVLTDTGQQSCYDPNGVVIECPQAGQALYGQDANYEGTQAIYRDNGNQTITDLITGLVWTETGEEPQQRWQDAIDYCDELVHAGVDNWRLPSKVELESIVNYNKTYSAIDEVFSCQSAFYWSSTPHLPNPPYAWGVYCLDGADHWLHKSNKYAVRCVRDGQQMAGAASDKLQWQQKEGKKRHTWQSGLHYCETLVQEGMADWRLPNIRELKTLANYAEYYPAADPTLSMQSATYWSSTTVGSETPSTAWAVFFGNGDDLWREKDQLHNVRCVRAGDVAR